MAPFRPRTGLYVPYKGATAMPVVGHQEIGSDISWPCGLFQKAYIGLDCHGRSVSPYRLKT